MRIIGATDEVTNHERYSSLKMSDGFALLLADLRKEGFTVDFSGLDAVKYDSKTDRYVGHFAGGHTVKLSDEVAEYLLSNKEIGEHRARPRVFLMLLKGAAIDVVLMGI